MSDNSRDGYALLHTVEAERTPLLQVTPQRSNSKEATGETDGLDIVQFSCPVYYCHEDSGVAVAMVMRLGTLSQECTVEFKTKDKSAKAGLKYVHTEGKITFFPNEQLKRIEIPIIPNDSFDTNLVFTLSMQNPKGCILCKELQVSSIAIMDDDFFPANKFREAAEKNEMDKVGLRMLVSFIVFSIRRIPDVGFRTYWTLILDQFHNANYLLAIWLNVYLVDIVFTKGPETEQQLWVKDDRVWTAVLVALFLTLPKALLSLIEYLQLGYLRVPGKVRRHLNANLFRKYLNYSAQSHAKVSPQLLVATMGSNVDALVEQGFMVIFKIAQQLIKGFVILYFLCRKRPSSALPLLVYPIASVFVLHMRYQKTLQLQDETSLADLAVSERVEDAYEHIELIKEYNMIPETVDAFAKAMTAASAPSRKYREYDFRTLLVMPWITNIAIALYIIVGGASVLYEEQTLGTFLATIAIYKDAGALFAEFYEHFKNCYTVISPLLTVVQVMNMESNMEALSKQVAGRTQAMEDQLKEMGTKANLNSKTNVDLLRISLVNASLYAQSQHISVSIPQAKLVAVLGPHATGKYSLLRVLKGSLIPRDGQVHLPPYLRCICVPRMPQFISRNVLDNLTFGSKSEIERSRLMQICKRMALNDNTIKLIEFHMHSDTKEATEAQKVPWHKNLNHSELLKLHIVRALYFNPEVLLLQRPVDEMDADHAATILGVLRDFVDNRGNLGGPCQNQPSHPRTVFFTSGEDRERADTAADVSDVVWHLSETGIREETGGATSHKTNSNRILDSWSRKAQNAHNQFQEEMDRHAATMKRSEEQEGELQHLVYQLGAWEQQEEAQGEPWFYDDPNSAKNRLQGLKGMLAQLPSDVHSQDTGSSPTQVQAQQSLLNFLP